MGIKQIIIRLISNFILFIKRGELERADIRFLVFTGTVGKTTIRNTISHVLKELGQPVESNQLGYSNEFGILLTVLGIYQFSFWSLKDWKILFVKKPSDGFVCIELGSDIYRDVDWFVKRFKPYAVFVGGIFSESWARERSILFEERQNLLESVSERGFIFFNSDDEESVRLVAKSSLKAEPKSISLKPQTKSEVVLESWTENVYKNKGGGEKITVHIKGGSKTFNISQSIFEPQLLSVLFAVSFVEAVLPADFSKIDTVFEKYKFSENRLQMLKARNGATILQDTYKNTPLCFSWFAEAVQKISARKKILVVTETRPEPNDLQNYYNEFLQKIAFFQAVYFIGPNHVFEIMSREKNGIQRIIEEEYELIAKEILKNSDRGDIIAIKGSKKYHLENLVRLLTSE